MNEYFEKFNMITDKSGFLIRHELVVKYSWAIPNEEAINVITKYSPVVEIGCGTGYWARLLVENGCEITPVDKYIKNNPYEHEIKWTHILEGDEDELTETPSDTNLFLCWPPYDEPIAYNCLKKFKGKYLIYVGENRGGCTATDDFFDELESNWEKIETVCIPRWAGIHDTLKVYKRKN